MDPFIAQVMAFGFNFPPRGWAFCDGQLLPIAQNTALFSLLGTVYGGNGQTTFALPDLRGRVVVHPGAGPGLTNIVQGERSGVENVTLTALQLPAHNHGIAAVNVTAAIGVNADAGGAFGNFLTRNATNTDGAQQNATATLAIPQHSTLPAGNNQPVGIRNPYVGIYVSIALYGIFPSRS